MALASQSPFQVRGPRTTGVACSLAALWDAWLHAACKPANFLRHQRVNCSRAPWLPPAGGVAHRGPAGGRRGAVAQPAALRRPHGERGRVTQPTARRTAAARPHSRRRRSTASLPRNRPRGRLRCHRRACHARRIYRGRDCAVRARVPVLRAGAAGGRQHGEGAGRAAHPLAQLARQRKPHQGAHRPRHAPPHPPSPCGAHAQPSSDRIFQEPRRRAATQRSRQGLLRRGDASLPRRRRCVLTARAPCATHGVLVRLQSASDPVGVLRLTSFNARAQRDLAKAITRLQDQGAKVRAAPPTSPSLALASAPSQLPPPLQRRPSAKPRVRGQRRSSAIATVLRPTLRRPHVRARAFACVQSFVLDLRDNRGGLVSEGLEVARLFLDGVRAHAHGGRAFLSGLCARPAHTRWKATRSACCGSPRERHQACCVLGGAMRQESFAVGADAAARVRRAATPRSCACLARALPPRRRRSHCVHGEPEHPRRRAARAGPATHAPAPAGALRRGVRVSASAP